MSADSSAGFHQEQSLGPAMMNPNVISFQSGAMNSSSMIGMGNYYAMNNSTGSLFFSGNSGMVRTNSPTAAQAGNSSASLLFDSVNGLKHDTGLAVEWSTDEQYKLEEGLIKYADVPSILKYVKIASMLREKNVRDVALRCRWMTVMLLQRKRRKQEESHLGRKGNYRKEKVLEPLPKTNLSVSSTPNLATHSFSMHQMDHNERIKWEMISRTARQILDHNIKVFGEINQNLSSLKLQDNISLFCRTRDNINNLCAIFKSTPGRMNHNQELPVSINQELADNILPSSNPMMMVNMSSGVPPKQNLRYNGAPPGVNV